MYMIKSKIAVIILFFFISTTLIAQVKTCNFNYVGKLVYAENGEILPNIVVYLVEIEKKVQSNEKGEFAFSNLCHQTYTLEIQGIGLKKTQKKIHIHQNTFETIEIHSDTCTLNEVVINANNEKVISSTYTVNSISNTNLDITRGESIGQTLKYVPGVNAIQTGPTIFKPMINGLYGNRIMLYNNGIRLESQNWGTDHAPEIDPFLASQINIIKGAATVQYGSEAIGGVVLLNSNFKPIKTRFSGELNLVGSSNNKQSVGNAIIYYSPKNAKLKGLIFRAQASADKSGNVKTPNYYLNNTGNQGYNYSWATQWKKERQGFELFYSQFNSKVGIFSGAHLHTISDVENVIKNGEPFIKSGFSYDINRPYQLVVHELIKAEAFKYLNQYNKLEITFARQYNQREEYDLDRPLNDIIYGIDVPAIKFSLTSYIANLTLNKIKKNTNYSIGLQSLIQTNNTTARNIRLFIPDYESNMLALFYIQKYKINKINLETGFRLENRYYNVDINNRNKNINFPLFTCQIGVSKLISEHLISGFNTSFNMRAPGINELYSNGLHHGTGIFMIGDSSLKNEKCWNNSLYLQIEQLKFNAEINVFYTLFNNYIYSQTNGQILTSIRGSFPVYTYQQTKASITGINAQSDIILIKNLHLIPKTAFIWAYNQSTDDYLINMPSNRAALQLKYAKSNSEKKLSEWHIKIGSEYVAYQNRYPKKSKIISNSSSEIFNNLVQYGDFIAPPKAYFLMNAEVLIKWKNIQTVLIIQNLLNQKYRDYLNTFRYFSDEMGQNIQLKVKYVF